MLVSSLAKMGIAALACCWTIRLTRSYLAATATAVALGIPREEALAMAVLVHIITVIPVAIAEMGALSERRLALLIDPQMSGLPAFLVENSGVNSGFMIAQVTAAALVSESNLGAQADVVEAVLVARRGIAEGPPRRGQARLDPLGNAEAGEQVGQLVVAAVGAPLTSSIGPIRVSTRSLGSTDGGISVRILGPFCEGVADGISGRSSTSPGSQVRSNQACSGP